MLVTRPGGALTAVRGGPFLHRAAAGRTWRVSAGVFWQVHPAAADVLAGAVLGTLRPQPGEVALDLYCGAGLFAGLLAEAVGPGGTVIGIESDPAAVRDARHNLRATPWARVHRGDAAEVLARPEPVDADIAVLDPPRSGAARGVLDRLRARRRACARWPTCPATRPRWPGTSRSAGGGLAAGPAPRVRRLPDDAPRGVRRHAAPGLTAAQRRPPAAQGAVVDVAAAAGAWGAGAPGRGDLLEAGRGRHLQRGQVGRGGGEPVEEVWLCPRFACTGR